jgi:hypothetical protein
MCFVITWKYLIRCDCPEEGYKFETKGKTHEGPTKYQYKNIKRHFREYQILNEVFKQKETADKWAERPAVMCSPPQYEHIVHNSTVHTALVN